MWNEEKLNELLTTPSDKLVADIAKIKGDIMVLGAGGKNGSHPLYPCKERYQEGRY